MGDIDFDELDKAVNSLMGQNAVKDKVEQPGASHASTASAPAQQPEPTPAVEPPTSSAASLETPVAPVAAPAAVRRSSGRFMDVIPSNNRYTSSRPTPTAPARREAAPIAPDAPAVAVDQTAIPSESFSQNTVDLDQNFDNNFTNDTPVDEAAPLSSPFLEGVEIDKRPLGSPAIDSDVLPTQEVDPGVMPDPIDFSQQNTDEVQQDLGGDPWGAGPQQEDVVIQDPVQPEFSPEMLAVEKMSFEKDEVIESQVSLGDEAQPVVQETEPVAQPAEVAAKETAAPLASGDIAQQYSPSAEAAPEPSAVFDAASETPATLNHPVKKKSGWSVIFWILLMIIVGVGGGVAVWFILVK